MIWTNLTGSEPETCSDIPVALTLQADLTNRMVIMRKKMVMMKQMRQTSQLRQRKKKSSSTQISTIMQKEEESKETKAELFDIDGKLELMGCDQLNEEVLVCMGEHRDWRKCQDQVKAFKQCFEDYNILKLWYYADKITEQEFYDLCRRRRFGGAEGFVRTGVENPMENSPFKIAIEEIKLTEPCRDPEQ